MKNKPDTTKLAKDAEILFDHFNRSDWSWEQLANALKAHYAQSELDDFVYFITDNTEEGV